MKRDDEVASRVDKPFDDREQNYETLPVKRRSAHSTRKNRNGRKASLLYIAKACLFQMATVLFAMKLYMYMYILST